MQGLWCRACGADPTHGGAWLPHAAGAPASTREDPDWQARLAYLEREGPAKKQGPAAALARAIAVVPGPARTLACLTAAYAAGARERTLPAWLSAAATGDPAAAPACAASQASVRERLEQDLVSPQAALRADALALAAPALGVSPVRVVLDALPRLPPSQDAPLGRLLADWGRAANTAVGRELLTQARPEDKPAVDRVLAVFAAQRDLHRRLLGAPTPESRKEALSALAPLAPLSAAELVVGLDDASAELRRLAATALARGEGRTLAEAAQARLGGALEASPTERLRWARALGPSGGEACPRFARATFRDRAEPDSVRALALEVLGTCPPADVADDLEAGFAEASVVVRAGAVNAAAGLVRQPRAMALAWEALQTEEPQVLEAAIPAMAAQALHRAVPRLFELTRHPAAPVRAAAVETLARLDPVRGEQAALRLLPDDEDAPVRAAAARALGLVGGPRSAPPLARAAQGDPDARVKFVAAESLRRLGLHVPSGSPHP